MARKRTIATAPGEPTIEVFFTAQEDADRDFEEANPPPPPTDEERIDAAFPKTDVARVIFEMFFQIINEIRALQDTVNGTTNGPISKVQLKDLLKSKLP